MDEKKKQNLKIALLVVLGSAVVSVVMGALTTLAYFLIGNDISGVFLKSSRLIYLSFGPALLLALLFMAIGAFKDHEFLFAGFLYYGTFIVSGLLEDKWFGEKITLYLIAAAISLALAFVARGALRWCGGKRNG